MAEYLFGVTHAKLTKREVSRRDKVARKYGFCFVYGEFPGEGMKGWFAGPNRGCPFDERTASAISRDLGL